MFGRDALTNLKHLICPKLRYMGMEELILDLEIARGFVRYKGEKGITSVHLYL